LRPAARLRYQTEVSDSVTAAAAMRSSVLVAACLAVLLASLHTVTCTLDGVADTGSNEMLASADTGARVSRLARELQQVAERAVERLSTGAATGAEAWDSLSSADRDAVVGWVTDSARRLPRLHAAEEELGRHHLNLATSRVHPAKQMEQYLQALQALQPLRAEQERVALLQAGLQGRRVASMSSERRGGSGSDAEVPAAAGVGAASGLPRRQRMLTAADLQGAVARRRLLGLEGAGAEAAGSATAAAAEGAAQLPLDVAAAAREGAVDAIAAAREQRLPFSAGTSASASKLSAIRERLMQQQARRPGRVSGGPSVLHELEGTPGGPSAGVHGLEAARRAAVAAAPAAGRTTFEAAFAAAGGFAAAGSSGSRASVPAFDEARRARFLAARDNAVQRALEAASEGGAAGVGLQLQAEQLQHATALQQQARAALAEGAQDSQAAADGADAEAGAGTAEGAGVSAGTAEGAGVSAGTKVTAAAPSPAAGFTGMYDASTGLSEPTPECKKNVNTWLGTCVFAGADGGKESGGGKGSGGGKDAGGKGGGSMSPACSKNLNTWLSKCVFADAKKK
jgi:hypothetical protein